MTVALAPQPLFTAFNNQGQFLVGGLLYTYAAGTSVPQATYIDSTQTTQNTNPVVLNAVGQAPVWLNAAQAYKFVLTDSAGNVLWTEDNITGLFAGVVGNLIPAADNTYTLGNASDSFAQVYVGPNHATLLNSGNLVYYARTAAEVAAGITPTTYGYPTLNILRYGGDNTGTTDNYAAFTSLIAVMKQLGGAATVLPPGTYNLATTVAFNLVPSVGTTSATNGMSFSGYGAVIKHTGTGYAFDVSNTNLSAYYYQPGLSWYGINIEGSASGLGGFRQSDVGAARYYDCFVYNYTAGAGFTQRNQFNYSENNHYVGCGVVTCLTGIAFVFTTGANASMARTTVHDFFGAGITNYWFDVGGGCSIYDSRFSHICGNFGSIAYFGIGTNTGNAGDMTATVIDGIDAEWDGNPNAFAQCIIRLRDYPQTANARRPILYNVGSNAQVTTGNPLPVWAAGSSNTTQTALTGPEVALTQALIAQVPITSLYGQSSLFDPQYNAAASRNAATTYTALSTCTLTGFTAAVSGRCSFNRSGVICNLVVYDSLTGTSNANSLTMTIYNPEFMPSAARNVPCFVEDNGNSIIPALAAFALPSLYMSITFTAALTVGAVSATLTANWTGLTGVYYVVFSDAEVRSVTLTNGAATATWTLPITGTPNTGAQVQATVVTFFIATAFNVYSATGFTASGTKGLTTNTSITYPL